MQARYRASRRPTAQAKVRFGIDEHKPLGAYYDRELLQVDERNNMQILLYGSLATGEDDLLPGHIWVEREALEVQNIPNRPPLARTPYG